MGSVIPDWVVLFLAPWRATISIGQKGFRLSSLLDVFLDVFFLWNWLEERAFSFYLKIQQFSGSWQMDFKETNLFQLCPSKLPSCPLHAACHSCITNGFCSTFTKFFTYTVYNDCRELSILQMVLIILR